MDLRIRALTPDDEPFLWVALYHAVHVSPGQAAPTPEIVQESSLARYVAGWMKRPGDVGFAAEVDGAPVGAAWLRRWQQGDHGFGFIDEATPELSMSLLPEYRGRGIGTALLRRLFAEVEQEIGAVSLSVSASNPARRLYARLGFAVVGGPDGGSLTMVRRAVPLQT